MNFKRFNETDAEYGKAAELAAYEMMKRRGFRVVHMPEGIYKEDLKCISNYEEFYVECERRYSISWKPSCDCFPYSTYNFPERRLKLDGSKWILLVFRSDLKRCLVVFHQDLQKATTKIVTNRHVTGERMFDIPINRCLLLDAAESSNKTFAEINHERITKLLEKMHKPERERFLEFGIPYGFSVFEYQNMLVEHTQYADDKNRARKSGYVQMSLFGSETE